MNCKPLSHLDLGKKSPGLASLPGAYHPYWTLLVRVGDAGGRPCSQYATNIIKTSKIAVKGPTIQKPSRSVNFWTAFRLPFLISHINCRECPAAEEIDWRSHGHFPFNLQNPTGTGAAARLLLVVRVPPLWPFSKVESYLPRNRARRYVMGAAERREEIVERVFIREVNHGDPCGPFVLIGVENVVMPDG